MLFFMLLFMLLWFSGAPGGRNMKYNIFFVSFVFPSPRDCTQVPPGSSRNPEVSSGAAWSLLFARQQIVIS